MNMPFTKSTPLPLLVAGVAAIMFSTAAATSAPLLDWLHKSSAAAPDNDPQAAVSGLPDAGELRPAAKCTECGVVESTRRVAQDGDLPTLHEITVRLRDGSIRVSRQVSPAQWRIGERIILIDGTGRRGA